MSNKYDHQTENRLPPRGTMADTMGARISSPTLPEWGGGNFTDSIISSPWAGHSPYCLEGSLGWRKKGGEEASEALESPGREAKMGVST